MYSVRSYQIANTINIKAVRNSFRGTLRYSDSDELFYELDENRYVYIFQFGVCCFFNIEEQKIQKLLEGFRDHTRNPIDDQLTEQFLVKVVKGVYHLSNGGATL